MTVKVCLVFQAGDYRIELPKWEAGWNTNKVKSTLKGENCPGPICQTVRMTSSDILHLFAAIQAGPPRSLRFVFQFLYRASGLENYHMLSQLAQPGLVIIVSMNPFIPLFYILGRRPATEAWAAVTWRAKR